MLSPDGRVVMVSGANRGIGLAVARCLYEKGYRLSLGGRDAAKLAASVGDLTAVAARLPDPPVLATCLWFTAEGECLPAPAGHAELIRQRMGLHPSIGGDLRASACRNRGWLALEREEAGRITLWHHSRSHPAASNAARDWLTRHADEVSSVTRCVEVDGTFGEVQHGSASEAAAALDRIAYSTDHPPVPLQVDRRALDGLPASLDKDRVITTEFDARDRASCEAWVARTADHFGRIDGLVNNAGISLKVGIEDDDEDAYDAMWEVNVKGPLRLIRLALPYLRRSGSGRIVNVSSLSGKRVKNENAGYAMSKFAVIALTHAVRRIGWEDGVRATAICPSFVATDMTAHVTAVTRGEMIQPGDLAELVATALALPNNAVVAELLVNCRLEDMF
jgi:NADP-dependent 3-hydroxy acid dehydrogenase YdfG